MAPIWSIDSTSNGSLSSSSLITFHTSYLSDPRTLPSLVESGEGHPSIGMAMPLSLVKVICQASYENTVDFDLSSLGIEEGDLMLLSILAFHSTYPHDFIDDTFTPDEVIV